MLFLILILASVLKGCRLKKNDLWVLLWGTDLLPLDYKLCFCVTILKMDGKHILTFCFWWLSSWYRASTSRTPVRLLTVSSTCYVNIRAFYRVDWLFLYMLYVYYCGFVWFRAPNSSSNSWKFWNGMVKNPSYRSSEWLSISGVALSCVFPFVEVRWLPSWLLPQCINLLLKLDLHSGW